MNHCWLATKLLQLPLSLPLSLSLSLSLLFSCHPSPQAEDVLLSLPLPLWLLFLLSSPQGSAVALAVACSLYPNQRIVISTEAAHASCEQRNGETSSLRSSPRSDSFHCPYDPRNLFFAIFRPKIACQAAKPPNSHKRNRIEW